MRTFFKFDFKFNFHPITVTGAPMALSALVAVYSLSVVTSLPGLAVSPILDQLQAAFPNVSMTEIEMLESLPSLLIIPFMLLAGKLSVNFSKRRLLIGGLSIFLLSSILYLIPIGGIGYMLFNSVLLGAGAGIIIPLSTGLIADYFSGAQRTRQLGIVSAISNLSLVLATALAGYLAGISWHASFLVYSLSGISFFFAFRVREPVRDSAPVPRSSVSVKSWPFRLMIFYYLLTTVALVVPFNLSVLLGDLKIGSSATSGNLISIFFLAITLPGFFLNFILRRFKSRTPFYALSLPILGLGIILTGNLWAILVGVMFLGFGYGILQPLIYDSTAISARPVQVTFFLALVMSMNYLSIILYPFWQRVVGVIFGVSWSMMPFISGLCLMVIILFLYWRIGKKGVLLHL